MSDAPQIPSIAAGAPNVSHPQRNWTIQQINVVHHWVVLEGWQQDVFLNPCKPWQVDAMWFNDKPEPGSWIFLAFWRWLPDYKPSNLRVTSAEFSIIWPDSYIYIYEINKTWPLSPWGLRLKVHGPVVQLANSDNLMVFPCFWMGNKTTCIACVLSEYLGWLKLDEISHKNRKTNGRNCMLPWFAPDMHCASKCPISQLQNMCDMCH